MAITGEPFEDYLKKQIDLRQEIHGKGVNGNRTSKEIAYLNSRTSWVKLASSTSISQSRLDFIPELKGSGLTGTKLAQGYVLFNGTSALNTNESSGTNVTVTPAVGNPTILAPPADAAPGAPLVEVDNPNYVPPGVKTEPFNNFSSNYASPKAGILGGSSNPAYGMTGNTDFGLVPMPGIESVNIKSMEMGSIKRASLVIKAHNRLQFDIIDMLYLRLGYTIMLEWGDSHYLDNENPSDPVTPMGNTLIETFWFRTQKTTSSTFKILEKIEKTREKYSSSYDGLFGRIVNFNWVFNPDGSYTINLDVLSLGDVVESLKTNTAVYKYYNDGGDEDEPDVITTNKYKGVLPYIFYQIYKLYLKNPEQSEGIEVGLLTGDERRKPKIKPTLESTLDELYEGDPITIESIGVDTTNETIGNTIPYKAIKDNSLYPQYDDNPNHEPGTISWNKVRENFVIGSQTPPIDYIRMSFAPVENAFYIRFGALLSILQDLIFPYYNTDKDQPAIKIDNEVETNLMNFMPNMVSIDPRVCLISNKRFKRINANGVGYQNDEKVMGQIAPFQYTVGDNTYGRIMNIYVNFKYVTALLNQIDKKGDVYLMGFLRNLCAGINLSLGGVNNLSPKVDPKTHTLKIFEESSLAGKENLPDHIFKKSSLKKGSGKFNLYGYSIGGKNNTPKNSSNFIHNVGIKTGVTPEYATMISIGATAAGEVVGEVATAFSKWNIGIKDRFNTDVLTSREINKISNQGNERQQKYRAIKTNYYKAISYKKPEESLVFLGLTKQLPTNGWFSPTLQKLSILGILSSPIGIGPTLSIANKIKSIFTPKESPTIKTTADDTYNFNNELIEQNLKEFKAYYKLIQNRGYQKFQKSSGTIGFMPFRLQLDMDGISGLKIYNKIEINSRFLPSNYPDSLEFIVTNVTHTLKNNQWVTSIDSIASVGNTISTKELWEALEIPPRYNPFFVGYNPLSNTYSNGLFKPQKSKSAQGPNANKLRNDLVALGYAEKGVEIDNGGDITLKAQKMGSAIFKKIKELYPSIKIVVTGGNDYFHQNLDYVSRHSMGNGIDFVIYPASDKNLDNVVGILDGFAKGENPNFRYIDEYRNLSSAATAPHFHLSWGKGTEGAKTLRKAIQNSPVEYKINDVTLREGEENESKYKAKQQEIRNINKEIKELGGTRQFDPNIAEGGAYNDINPELQEAREYRNYLRGLKDSNSPYGPTIKLNPNEL